MKKNFEINMCEGSHFKNIVSFAIPLMLSGIIQLLYGAVDMVVVGNFAGSESMAAVGSTGALTNLIINVFTGLSIGVSVVVAKAYGAGDYRSAGRSVHTAMALAGAGGVFLAVLGFFVSRPLLSMMGSPADVIDKAALYMKIYFLGMPAFMIYNFGSSVLRAMGDTKRSLFIITLSGIANVALNLVFVINLHMDVAGVAVATVISQIISAVMIVLVLLRTQGCYRLFWRQLRFHRQELISIMKVGLPAGLQASVFSLSNVVIQSTVNSFGSVVIAGNAAAASLEGFVFTCMNSFYNASLTCTSQNFGAKKFERIKKGTLTSLLCVTAVGLLMGGAMLLLRGPLLGIYSSDIDVIKAGENRVMIIMSAYFLCGIMEVLVGTQRGFGSSVTPMIVSLTGACLLRVIWVYTIFVASGHNIYVLYLSYPASWLITAFAQAICTRHIFKKRVRENEGENGEAAGSKKILYAATVVHGHIMRFHIPFLKMCKEAGWETAVAAKNDFEKPQDCKIPYCDTYYDIAFERSPFKAANLRAYKRLKKVLEEGAYEIVHCHTPVAAFCTRLACARLRKRGTRVIYTAHGFHFYEGAPLKNWLMYYPAERLCARRTDVLITINHEDYSIAKRKMKAKEIRYVPGVGIDAGKFEIDALTETERDGKRRSLGIEQDESMLLSVGELIKRKNHETVIRALAKLPDAKVKYFICGRGELYEYLGKLIMELGLSERVKLLGFRADIAELCACADLYVFPSFQEGLPVALMEAMASGLPCVASRIRGNSDLLADGVGGYLCDPHSADEFAQAIIKAMENDALRADALRVHRKTLEPYALENVIESMKEIYRLK